MNNLQVIRLQGAELFPYLEQLGQLRIQVFYDFPYLYEGTLEYEKKYLNTYVNNPQSFIVGLLSHDQWIGATTAIPLEAETAAVRAPFIRTRIPLASVFYLGESMLLPEFRGKGYGHLFFDERERFAIEQGYSTTAFCSVLRPEKHPLRPKNYRSNEAFWTKRGYTRRSDLRCQMSWLDRGDSQETIKELEFWIKEWK